MPEKETLIEWYRKMVLIRHFDEKRAEIASEFPTPQQHPHFGQEAVSVGAIAALQPDDYVVGTHRCIGHAIAKGMELNRITAELFGKTTGYAGGRAGEMSFQSVEHGFLASGVVGNTVPIATGLGLAAKLKRSGQVCLSFFGDSAVNTGLFHEGVNLAAIWDCPVVFLCENNQFGLTTAISRATRLKRLADKADGYGISGIQVDGMDVLAVYEAVSNAVEQARNGKGPYFIECLTYRLGGYNVFTDPNQGVGLYRTQDEVEQWKKRCPITVFKGYLQQQGFLTPDQAQDIERSVVEEIEVAVNFARSSSYPEPETITHNLFAPAIAFPEPPVLPPAHSPAYRELSLRAAIREAIDEEMQRDEGVFILGEEVGLKGGIFGVTRGLMQKFGEDRVHDTPVSEGGILGAAIGAALGGLRPIPEIMIVDFVGCGGAMAMIFNEMSTIPYLGNGRWRLPIVLRIPCGSRWPMISPGAHHNGCLDAWFTAIPGLRVVVPSTPYDAKGLMKTAIHEDNPVIFLEHKHMYTGRGTQRYDSLAEIYPSIVSHVPREGYLIPFGKADVKRPGNDVTVLATMMMVHKSLRVAQEMAPRGVSLEVIDPRTLAPFDRQTVLASVAKTGRLVVATEDSWQNGSGAGMVAALIAEAFPLLKAPIQRVAALDVPIPYGQHLEGLVIPDEQKIRAAIEKVLQ